MAFLNRHLTAFAILSAASVVAGNVFAPFANAQPEAPANAPASPITFRTLAVGNPSAVAKLLYESQGKSVPLQANTLDLSPAYNAPPSGRVVLFREAPPIPPETKPRKIPVTEAQLGSAGQYLLLLSAPAEGGKVTSLAIDDSWNAQPPETLRVFNFSRRRVAIQIGAESSELTTAQSVIAPFPKNSRIVDLKVAVWEKGEWLLASNNPPALIPRTRLILVITDMAPSPENPRPVEVDINGVYDTRPPPEPAKRS